MSGFETAAAVIGLTWTVIDASVQIYDAVKDKSGIPEKLRKVSDTLPSLLELLEGAKTQAGKRQPTEQAWIEVKKDVERCFETCQQLHDILKRAYPEADAGTAGRVFKNVGNLVSRKSKTAEQLLKDIHGYLEILKQRQIITNSALLDDIKKTVDELFPQSGQILNNVHGTNVGGDQVNNNTGQQFIGTGGGTFTFNTYPIEDDEKPLRRKLRERLRFPLIDDRRTTIKKAHQDTFQWVLSPTPSTEDSKCPGSDFVEWLRSGSGIYWIQGKMGCGKSTLMKYVTEHELTKDHLLGWANGQTLHCPSYYFSKTGTSELQKSLEGLYRTLLATLLRYEGDMFSVAFPDWQILDFNHQPTSAVLREALENILKKSELSCKYCIFIDGLDEYQETDNEQRTELAEQILGLAQLSAVKLVVSSRPEDVFKLRFAHCLTMELHRLTSNDIAAYVDAEIRRRVIPDDLTKIETPQLNSLCDEVVEKAEGVFLWVKIAVASILHGIEDDDALPKLISELGKLDPDLRVLFRQVLTERVKASHRKQVARSLLTEGRYDHHIFHDGSGRTHAIVQAISPHVDASPTHDYRRLLKSDREIDVHVSDLQRRLPGRSCGLYLGSRTAKTKFQVSYDTLTPLKLSHSSLYDFINEGETRALLLEQAGDDFQVYEAIAVGQMAELVNISERKQYYHGDYTMVVMLEIMHSIEMAEISTGLAQTKLLSTFDELLGRDSDTCNPRLVDYSTTNWDPLYEDEVEDDSEEMYSFPLLRSRGVSRDGSDLLSMTLTFGFSCYLKHKTNFYRGVPQLPPKAGTPLLFYPLWTKRNYHEWVKEETRDAGMHSSHNKASDETCYSSPVKLLLEQGADPNECCCGLTPWSSLLRELYSERDDDLPPRRVGQADAFVKPEKSLLDKLEIARLMLQHGADPLLCMDTPLSTISTQIFAQLLEQQCCRGHVLDDCSCDYARHVRPQLTNLVDLVEELRRNTRQTRTEGELLVPVSRVVMLFGYILRVLLTWLFLK